MEGRVHTYVVTHFCEKVGSEVLNLTVMDCGETSHVAIQDMINSECMITNTRGGKRWMPSIA